MTAAAGAGIGISTPRAGAGSSTGPHDATPSAVWLITAAAAATDMPRPRFSPNVLLRDSGELQVATRSPIPARPAHVCRCAPSAEPSLAISASPPVIPAPLVLYPSPIATAMPTAIALTFFPV